MNSTSAIALTIFDHNVNPNHRMNSGTRVTRGNEFSSTRNGTNTAESHRFEARTTASAIPMTPPTISPNTVSSIVITTSRTTYPCCHQLPIVAPISLGDEKKNGSIRCTRTPSSHASSTTTTSAAWIAATARRSTGCVRSRIALQHLVAQIVPRLGVQLGEARIEPGLLDVARPRQRDVVARLHPRRPRRHHDDLVGERDRLFEIVRH